MTSSDAAGFLREKESCAKRRDEDGPSAKKALLNFDGGAKETPLNTEECNIHVATARFLKRDKLMVGEVLDSQRQHIPNLRASPQRISWNTLEKPFQIMPLPLQTLRVVIYFLERMTAVKSLEAIVKWRKKL